MRYIIENFFESIYIYKGVRKRVYSGMQKIDRPRFIYPVVYDTKRGFDQAGRNGSMLRSSKITLTKHYESLEEFIEDYIYLFL